MYNAKRTIPKKEMELVIFSFFYFGNGKTYKICLLFLGRSVLCVFKLDEILSFSIEK